MKIVSLQSIGLGDYDPTIEGMLQPLVIGINHNYPYGGRRVELIELVAGGHMGIANREPATYFSEKRYFRVVTSDRHIRIFPEQSYIAEWAEVDE